jgi:uncharacterized damage-inducible protein DinB
MKVKEIAELFDYNVWANTRQLEAAAQLTTDQYMQDFKASHGGIHGTLTHIVAAQKLWLSRWRGTPDDFILHGKDLGSLLELIGLWERVSSETAEFIATLTEEKLLEPFQMTTTAGKQFTHSFQETMQHFINHSSTHRGQVNAMIRQLGIRPPSIDLITYYRQKQ